jgi:hypothetical protein
VITVLAGSDADLLDGTLNVTAANNSHSHGLPNWRWLALLVAVFTAAGFYYHRKKKSWPMPRTGAAQ